MHVPIQLSVALAMLVCATTSYAQKVYRCGSAYTATPCGSDARQINIPVASPVGPGASIDFAAHERKLRQRVPDVQTSESQITANKLACVAGVRSALKDPDSAKFEPVTRTGSQISYENGLYVPRVHYAVNVNAKNSYGGYTGAKPWFCLFDALDAQLVKAKSYD
jgi:hypothetical protein